MPPSSRGAVAVAMSALSALLQPAAAGGVVTVLARVGLWQNKRHMEKDNFLEDLWQKNAMKLY